ncbi:MAG: hypothetical protein ACM3WV_07290 [Bacillota bacterium]
MKTYIKTILACLMFLFYASGCEGPLVLDVSVQEGVYQLKSLNRLTPYYFADKKNSPLNLFNINLKMTNKCTILADLKLLHPLNAVIKLGNLNRPYLLLFDVESEKMTLYLDDNGDLDITPGETTYQLYKQKVLYYNMPVAEYFTAVPIRINVPYEISGKREDRELLIIPFVLKLTDKSYRLLVVNRHWLVGKGKMDQEDVYFAVVDQNANGIYHDPKDIIFFDLDKDGVFRDPEGVQYKKLNNFLDATGSKFQVVLGEAYPQTIKVVKVGKG